jgi:formylglycine-generating enzyme required for sulfatase activity
MARLTVAALAFSALAIWTCADRADRDVASAEEKSTNASQREQAQDKGRPEFKEAGVCARCHVFHVLEWGISKHVAEETNCQSCHGPSRAHVANERNEVPPDRLPRGPQIAQLCSSCHDAGCPKTMQRVTCEKCHHAHGLVNPEHRPPAEDDRLKEVFARWDRFRARRDEGDRLVQLAKWSAARQAYSESLAASPGNHDVRRKIALCERRLNPSLPGFEIIGKEFDPQTGLPKEVRVAGLGIAMVLVPPGDFDLGSDKHPSAGPVHTVHVEPFYMAKFELTQREWQSVMGTNPSAHQGDGYPQSAEMPVESVSWNDCRTLLGKLNDRIAGGGFRLPTEAEWEFACDDGACGKFDPSAVTHVAWYRENASREPDAAVVPQAGDTLSPRPIGKKTPNRRGLHDMQGNVSEWCSSRHVPYPYDATDGREALTERGLRVIRGGGFADSAESLDPAFRHGERPERVLRWNGLRLARSVPEPLRPKARDAKARSTP